LEEDQDLEELEQRPRERKKLTIRRAEGRVPPRMRSEEVRQEASEVEEEHHAPRPPRGGRRPGAEEDDVGGRGAPRRLREEVRREVRQEASEADEEHRAPRPPSGGRRGGGAEEEDVRGRGAPRRLREEVPKESWELQVEAEEDVDEEEDRAPRPPRGASRRGPEEGGEEGRGAPRRQRDEVPARTGGNAATSGRIAYGETQEEEEEYAPRDRRRSAEERGEPRGRGQAVEALEVGTRRSIVYQRLTKLLTKKGRQKVSRYIAEGAKFLRFAPRTVFVRMSRWDESRDKILTMLAEGGEEGPDLLDADTNPLEWGSPLLSDAGLAGDPPGICVLSDELFDSVTTQEASQGIICIFAVPKQRGTDWATGNRVIVLDAVKDSRNLGVIMRTMEAFDAKTLILSKGSTDVYNPKVVRCSMGAVVRGGLQVLLAEDSNELRDLLKGYQIFSTDMNGEVSTADLPSHLTGKDAFIFGNEATGVSADLQGLARKRLRIPIADQVESLNVGVSVGIVLHAVAAR